MTYKLGQVLFVAVKGKAQILPIQVIEETTKKTLNGDQVEYMVSFGVGDTGKKINIATIEGEIFDTSAKAQKTLIERSSKQIAKLIQNAVDQAKAWYPSSFEAPEQVAPVTNSASIFAMMEEQTDSHSSNEPMFIELPDGTKARVALPDSLKS